MGRARDSVIWRRFVMSKREDTTFHTDLAIAVCERPYSKDEPREGMGEAVKSNGHRDLNKPGRKVVSGGKYVISNTPSSSTNNMGIVARITSTMGLLKR